MNQIWDQVRVQLQLELSPALYATYIEKLLVDMDDQAAASAGVLTITAPNRFVRQWVSDSYLDRIEDLVFEASNHSLRVELVQAVSVARTSRRRGARRLQAVDTSPVSNEKSISDATRGLAETTARLADTVIEPVTQHNLSSADLGDTATARAVPQVAASVQPALNLSSRDVKVEGGLQHKETLNSDFTFDSFVEGKSNQLARAAAQQVATNAGGAYNPLFIYGGVGLGKTHLMHAVGNAIRAEKPDARILYLHSERFVQDMVKALQLNAISDFKRYYRGVDALLIDDIQFFVGKERSQEEFFHTFNALLEGGQQVILTSDRFPKEIKLDERLSSRFGWGLTVAVEPPELEMRVAILMKKAAQMQIELPQDAAFFIAQRIQSNVRELEGALKRVVANANFKRVPVDIPLIKDSLKDLLALQDRQVSIDNIQRVVAEFFNIKVADLLSKRRSRSVARPRQIAMALAKQLTNHSYPEIGDAFGGRDHTTVLHACRKVDQLKSEDAELLKDYNELNRKLTS